MQWIKHLILWPLAVIVLAACAGSGSAPEAESSAVTETAAVEPAEASEQLIPDGVWQADTGAVLTIRGGEPVAYTFGDYEARRLSVSGSTVRIDDARLRINEVRGQQFEATFTLSGQTSATTFVQG